MQITRTYNAGLDKVHVGEIDGHPYLCIPEGLFLFTDDPPEELLGKGLVVSWACSNCTMPLNSYHDPQMGEIYFCSRCESPDTWIPLNYMNLQVLIPKATAAGDAPLRAVLLEIQQKEL
jgi:hypothetical protein